MGESGRGAARGRVVAGALGAAAVIVVSVPSSVAAFGACIGSEGAGVEADSLRGAVCDTPMGPWPYLVLGALVGTFVALRKIRNDADDDAALLWAGLPALLVFLVPLLIGLLPRT